MSPSFRSLTAIVVTVLALAGLASFSNYVGAAESPKPLTEYHIGLVQISAVLPIYVGIKKGFFKEEGLDVKPNILKTGPDIVASVLSGTNQVGLLNTVSAILAISKGVPIEFIAPTTTYNPGEESLYIAPGSGIRNAKDLEGKRIAVIGQKNIQELGVIATLVKHGASQKKLQFVNMPVPDMPGALDRGDVAAATLLEPFVTIGTKQGLKELVGIYEGLGAPSTPIAINIYFTSKENVAKNAKQIGAFKRGLEKSIQYIKQNPDDAREVLTAYTSIKPDLARLVTLPNYPIKLSVHDLNVIQKAMVKYGYMKGEVDLNSAVYKGQ